MQRVFVRTVLTKNSSDIISGMDIKPEATVFKADSVSIRGPKETDSSYTVTFQVGEYQGKNIQPLLIQNNRNVTVVVTEGDYD